MGFLDALKKKIADFRKAPETIPQRVAPKAQAMIRESSRTARGNVPWFKGPLRGSFDLPTTVTANGDELKIVMVDWALARENEKDLSGRLAALVRAEAVAALRGK
jgi:hypothetical protein